MKSNIQNFLMSFIIVITIFFGSIFSYYFYKQEQAVASVILKTIKSNLSEASYTLSKSIKTKNDILSYRALLDRISSNNDFIASIAVLDDNKLILVTDPAYSYINKVPNNFNIKDAYDKLMKQPYLEDNIRFYEGKDIKKLRLLYILEHEEILSHFIRNKLNFFTYFGLLPIITFLLFLFFLRKYISKPLEELRQYAYYNNKVPKAFMLHELEAIRHSMVDTFSRLENEKNELYLMARTDALSGLANRNSLNEYVERLISTSKRAKKEFAFMVLDMDNFKTINDAFGHNIGDEFLQNVATLFKRILRPSDFIARVGGDEFVIIVQEYESYLELSNIINRVQRHLSKNWIIKTNPINVTGSVGVAFFPKDGANLVGLMKNADIAMYEAKKLGKNQFHFFTEELNQSIQQTISLDKDMRQALKNNEFELYYQPKVDIKSSEIIGVEALIRWISPTKGIIPPNVFIPLAEENNFIKELGEWIVDEAISQYVSWRTKGLDIKVSINISAKQFSDNKFVNRFISRLENNRIEASKIDMEITEYMFIEESGSANNNLKKVHDSGVTISLDDFGTGYSSLSYLKNFPIDYLKIDKAFLDDFNSSDGAVFLETIVKMGQMLNIQIIAEGVELKEQLEYLKSIGCDQYQGYFCAKPLCAKDFEDFYLVEYKTK